MTEWKQKKKICVSEKIKNLIPTVNIIMSYNLQNQLNSLFFQRPFPKESNLSRIEMK